MKSDYLEKHPTTLFLLRMSVFSINIHGVYIVDFTVLDGFSMGVSIFILSRQGLFLH